MKNKYIFGALAVAAAMSVTSCSDFLDDNRDPLSSLSFSPEFWNSEVNTQDQVNTFYNDYQGYGDRSSTNGTFYYTWLSDDQCARTGFNNWTYTSVPATASDYSTPYEEIRRACFVIDGMAGSTLDTKVRNNFEGLGRLHRARQYYKLVQRYGDVILVKHVVDMTDNKQLYGKPTDRNTVMDFVLEDLNYAVENITAEKGKTTFSRDMAQAFKLEVCLFEGAYAKYHQNDLVRAKKFFEEAEKAGLAVVDKYPVGADYASLYNTLNDGLSSNGEIIMYKQYQKDVFMNSITDYSNASDGVAGITRDAFNAFLFKDGKNATTTPATTYNTTDEGVLSEEPVLKDDGTPDVGDDGVPKTAKYLKIQNLLDVRDGRLSAITYPYASYKGCSWSAPNTGGIVSPTGYGVKKFNNYAISKKDANSINKNYCSAPLFWGARVCVGLLEAKAELQKLSDTDLEKYMKPLWRRAGFTDAAIDGLTVAYLNGLNDTANNMGVSSLIWEIRRLRRCELMLDDGIRYWDLVRWHQLELLDSNTNPNVKLGVNVKNAPIKPEAVAMSGDYINAYSGLDRTFNAKYYFYPIPTGQRQLNPDLGQNEGWN